MTLADHLSTAHPALAELVLAVADACVEIAGVVRRGGAEHAAAVSVNVQGEVQKGLDVLANDILIRVAGASPALVAMGSEEMDDIIPVRDLGPEGGYFLLFDPLDGSSNIDVNISVGTIFSILPAKGAMPARAATEADLMQPGRNQVAAGYVVYGPQVTLVLTLGELPAKGYASHGESWSFALGLRLAAYQLLRHDLGDDPVLILDDVFAELDSGRRERLAAMVGDCEQVLITAAVAADVPSSLSGRTYAVRLGEVGERE